MEIALEEYNIYAKGFILSFPDNTSVLKRTKLEYNQTSTEDVTHVVRQGDTIYAIAHKYYKDDRWWHVIADVNSIYNPFELTEGTELLIPDLDVIKALRK